MLNMLVCAPCFFQALHLWCKNTDVNMAMKWGQDKLQMVSAYYAPPKDDEPPPSALDNRKAQTKMCIVLTIIFMEVATYIGLIIYFDKVGGARHACARACLPDSDVSIFSNRLAANTTVLQRAHTPSTSNGNSPSL